MVTDVKILILEIQKESTLNFNDVPKYIIYDEGTIFCSEVK